MRFRTWTPDYYGMRCRRSHRVMRFMVKRMASLLFCQPRGYITVAPALLFAAIPSRRTAVLVSCEDIAPMLAVRVAIVGTIVALRTITPLELVYNFVGVVFRPLRQRRRGAHSQAHYHDHPKSFAHKSPSTSVIILMRSPTKAK
jgi:hypothetical protein